MKNLILVFVLSLFISESFSQAPTVKFGSESKVPASSGSGGLSRYPSYIIGEVDGSYLIVTLQNLKSLQYRVASSSTNTLLSAAAIFGSFPIDDNIYIDVRKYFVDGAELYIHEYDKDLNLIQKNEIKYKSENKHIAIKPFPPILIDNELYFPVLKLDKELKKLIFGYYNLEKNGSLGDFITLNDSIEFSDFGKFNFTPTAEMITSPDGKIALLVNYFQDDQEQETSLTFYVISNNFQDIKEKKVKLDYKILINDVKLQNDGTISFISKTVKRETSFLKEKILIDYFLNIINTNSFSLKSYAVALETEKNILDLHYSFENGDNIFLYGFYSNIEEKEIEGLFLQKIDRKTLTSKDFITVQFDNKFIETYTNDNSSSKSKELDNYYIRELHINENGSLTFIAEKYFIKYISGYTSYKHGISDTEPDGKSIGFERDYRYSTKGVMIFDFEDIMIFNIDSLGSTINWAKNINKRQLASREVLITSFISIWNDDNVHIIYTGFKNKYVGPRTRDDFYSKKVTTYLTNIDAAGNISDNIIFSTKETGWILTPRVFYEIDNNNVIIQNIEADWASSRYNFSKISF